MLNEARVVADVMPKSQLLAMSLDAKAKAMTLFGTEKVTWLGVGLGLGWGLAAPRPRP